uniref:Uncharacterized protein n=1 Tax=Ovis aries TaxID=9940 RepID=A0AC11CMI1_SHEEP
KADSLPAEPPGKPKNTGVNSLSLLQGIFPTQELTRGLLHCRWILYQLSYQTLHSVFIGDNMPTAKQLADIGYKTFSTSMMLLTVYGGYLCSVRAYHYFQRRSSQRQAAEEQKTSGAL